MLADFIVSSDLKESIQLNFEGIEVIPEIHDIYLIDENTAQFQNLRIHSTYTFTPVMPVSRFRVLVGILAFVFAEAKSIIPDKFALEQSFQAYRSHSYHGVPLPSL